MYCPQPHHVNPQAMQKAFAQHYYSSTAHARNRRATNTGNIIRCSIPGLKDTVDIPFPDGKLPVCQKCKKIYKTRELCRVRDRHTEAPWSTTYVCVTVDESCFQKVGDEENLVEEGPFKFIANSIPAPTCTYIGTKKDLGGTKSPICMACKDKNYTRHHCRVKNSHLQMPWATSYVVLSAIPSGNGSYSGNASIQTVETSEKAEIGSKRSRSDSQADDASVKKSKSDDSSISTKDNANDDEASTDVVEKRQTFSDYKGCKAFLLTIGKGDCVLSVSRFGNSLSNLSFLPIRIHRFANSFPPSLQWLEVDPTSSVSTEHDGGAAPWMNHQHDNMYQNHAPPPYYNNAPPSNWSGYNDYFPGGHGPNNMYGPPPPHMQQQHGMYGSYQQPPYQSYQQGQMPYPPMNNGRNTPANEYGMNNNYSYPPQQNYNQQQNPSNNRIPGQTPPYQNNGYNSFEDRENQASLMNQGPPNMNHNNNNGKPFQQHAGNERGSPSENNYPLSKPGYMTNNQHNTSTTHNSNGNNSPPSVPPQYLGRDNNNVDNSYAPPPHMNVVRGGGYNNGNNNNVPFYAAN